jgi:acetate kinase
MPQIILSINAGSSSLKVSVYKPAYNANQDPIELAVCTIEGLTAPPARIKYSRPGIETIKKELSEIKNQADAFAAVLNQLLEDDGLPEIKQKEDIKYAVHRVVHGGDYPCCQIIDKQTMSQIEHLSDLAPL